ncbi:hypothetical protein RV10_GL003608 [Enterococcus pallens]|nr:hypothetical protein RV10_GL003608 [Enterococcus pallens]
MSPQLLIEAAVCFLFKKRKAFCEVRMKKKKIFYLMADQPLDEIKDSI